MCCRNVASWRKTAEHTWQVKDNLEVVVEDPGRCVFEGEGEPLTLCVKGVLSVSEQVLENTKKKKENPVI